MIRHLRELTFLLNAPSVALKGMWGVIMCLKEFHIITFTTREAYERALKRLDKFQNKSIEGNFYIIDMYLSTSEARNRKVFTFEGLKHLLQQKLIRTQMELSFKNWTQLDIAIKMLGEREDIFGEIRVELR